MDGGWVGGKFDVHNYQGFKHLLPSGTQHTLCLFHPHNHPINIIPNAGIWHGGYDTSWDVHIAY